MKTLILSVTLTGLMFGASAAHAADFETSHSFVPATSGWSADGQVPTGFFPMTMGTVDQHPALDIAAGDGSRTLLVRLNPARKYADADSACKNLGPAGKYHLPNPGDAFLLFMSGAYNSAVTINPDKDGDVHQMYPIWVTADISASDWSDAGPAGRERLKAQSDDMRASNVVMVMADGLGDDASGIPLDDLRAGMPDSVFSQPRYKQNENTSIFASGLSEAIHGNHVEQSVATQLQNGLPVYCVDTLEPAAAPAQSSAPKVAVEAEQKPAKTAPSQTGGAPTGAATPGDGNKTKI